MSPKKLTRLVLVAAVLPATLLQQAGASPARRASHKTPLVRSQIVPTARAAPDMTSTITPLKQATLSDEALPKPFELPVAPRARMHACGEKWQNIKMAGHAADQTWREFATGCLAALDAPRKPSP